MIDVKLESVSKRFTRSGEAAAAVDDVTLTIAAGEFFTLLGPSGCGKTTTLRMVAGFYFPTVGHIRFGDQDVTRLAPNKRDAGMVFQNYALFPHMSVAQNVAYGLKVRKVSRAEAARRVKEALAEVHLDGYGSRRIDQLSGGQQQRVALARALVIRPRTLLLDEPLSNLDAKLREETRTEIRRIQRESGTTSLYVTHDQAEAMAMSDRIAVMQSGKVQQIGTPREVYHQPANAFVARFIGRSNVLSLPVTTADATSVGVALPGGGRVTAAAPQGHGLREGDTALVAARPEHLAIVSPQEPGTISGKVTGVEFTGMATHLTVDVGTGGPDGEVTVAAVDVPDRVDVGDHVGLRLPADRLWVVRPMTAVSSTVPSRRSEVARRLRGGASAAWFPYLLAAPLVLILWGYVVQPMLATFVESVSDDGTANYTQFFTSSGVARTSLITSLIISAASVVLCAVVGVAMAFLLKRFSFAGRSLIEAFILVPAALPPLIGAISFQLLYSEIGILPRGLQQLLGTAQPVLAFDGIAGVLVVHTFTMYPFFYLAASAALAGLDPSIEEAAYNLGAGRIRVWRTVLLPMLTPALVSASLLVFMTSLASYTAPLLFGVDQTMTMQIYINRTNGDLPMASTYASVLGLVSIAFLLLMRWYEGRRSYLSQSKGISARRREIANPIGRWLAPVASVLATLVLLAPVATIALVAFSQDGSWTTEVIPSAYTVENFVTIFTEPRAFQPIVNSLRMSLLATAACVVIGVLIAYAVRRLKFVGRSLLDIGVMIAWALPGTVVAINLISAFSTGNGFSFGQALIGTFWILPLAYFVRFLPLVFRASSASLALLDPSLEEAARNLGASWWRAFLNITVRLMLPGVIVGALLAFVHGVGEFVASVLIYTSSTAPISVAINNRMYSFEIGTAAAYGMLQVVLIFVVMWFSGRLEGGGRAASRRAEQWTN